jgi:hypothetical protein
VESFLEGSCWAAVKGEKDWCRACPRAEEGDDRPFERGFGRLEEEEGPGEAEVPLMKGLFRHLGPFEAGALMAAG